jgi:hypothetical protein
MSNSLCPDCHSKNTYSYLNNRLAYDNNNNNKVFDLSSWLIPFST